MSPNQLWKGGPFHPRPPALYEEAQRSLHERWSPHSSREPALSLRGTGIWCHSLVGTICQVKLLVLKCQELQTHSLLNFPPPGRERRRKPLLPRLLLSPRCLWLMRVPQGPFIRNQADLDRTRGCERCVPWCYDKEREDQGADGSSRVYTDLARGGG